MRTEVETQVNIQLGRRNRLTTFFRGILAIPALIIVSLLVPSIEGSGPLPIIIGFSIVFFTSYPAWLIAFSHGMLEFASKTNAYFLLLTDNYPNFSASNEVKVFFPDIAEGKLLNRWLPLVKWLLAIPHYIVIFIATPGIFAVALFNWFVILFTGNYSGAGSKFTLGYISYVNRVAGYAFAMVTDSYPRIITK